MFVEFGGYLGKCCVWYFGGDGGNMCFMLVNVGVNDSCICCFDGFV